MLPTSANTREAVFRRDGAAQTLARGSVVMEMDTGSPADLLILEADLAARGLLLAERAGIDRAKAARNHQCA